MKLFERNVGPVDRVVRVVVGLLLLAMIVVGPQTWWGLLGIIPLATGASGICPLYALLHVRTDHARGHAAT